MFEEFGMDMAPGSKLTGIKFMGGHSVGGYCLGGVEVELKCL